MSDTLGHKAASGAIWATIDRMGTMCLQFIVNLVLARLLLPKDFGMIGMLAIFIAVSQTLIDSGFASALIQKKHPTQTDFSTIFIWNIIFSLILYIILYFTSPWIAEFYKMPLLSSVLRVIAITLIINGAYAIQRTRLQKDLAFRTLCIANICSCVCGDIVGIVTAYFGWGVWSLVWMQIITGIVSILSLFIITKWVPSGIFSIATIKELFGFGGFIMAANILQTICQNLQGLIIGKKFSATQMGYFSQAYKLDQVTSRSFPQVIVQVMYPVYSSIQDDRTRLNNMVLMNMRVIAFIIFPLLSILILAAKPLILFLYGEKWLFSAPYFQVLCVGGFFVCLQNLNFYAVAAVGKSKSLFNTSIYKWSFLLIALLIGMNIGMYGILWGMVLSSFNIYITNAYLSSKYTGLRIKNQLAAIFPVLILSIFSMGLGFLLEFLGCHIALSCILTLIIYIIGAYVGRFQAINDTTILVKKLIIDR